MLMLLMMRRRPTTSRESPGRVENAWRKTSSMLYVVEEEEDDDSLIQFSFKIRNLTSKCVTMEQRMGMKMMLFMNKQMMTGVSSSFIYIRICNLDVKRSGSRKTGEKRENCVGGRAVEQMWGRCRLLVQRVVVQTVCVPCTFGCVAAM